MQKVALIIHENYAKKEDRRSLD